MSYRGVDGNECDGNGRALGEPPERKALLVSISEMNRRIAERDAEVARLTAENDRLIVIAKADEWQARYWAEHDAVADRDATIMAAELQGWWDKTKTMAADLAAVVARKDLELAAYRKALEPFAEWSRSLRKSPNVLGPSCPLSIEPEAGPITVAVPRSPGRTKCVADLHEAEAILQSSDPGKALLDAHAAQLEKLEHLLTERSRQALARILELEAHAAELAEAYKIADCWAKAESGLNEMGMERDALRQQLATEREKVTDAREDFQFYFRKWNEAGYKADGAIRERDEALSRAMNLAAEVLALRQRAEAAESRATCDGSTERTHTETTKAAIAALWETNPEIAYESPAQVIGWLKGRAEAAEAKLRAVDDVLIVHHLGPRDDGDYRKALAGLISNSIAAVREQVKAAETDRRQIAQDYARDTEAYLDQIANLRASQAADLNRIEESYNVLIRELEERARKAESARMARQRQVATWCAEAFGAGHAASIPQRGIRLLEETIEAAQSCGCEIEMAHRLVDHVFARGAGDLGQELGGVGVTLLALAAAAQLDADEEEAREVARVLSKPLEHFKARNQQKNAAGFNVADAMEIE